VEAFGDCGFAQSNVVELSREFNNKKGADMSLPKITLQKLAVESGYTEEALRGKIARGEFIEGKHYIKAPDGRIHFIVEEYLKWVESNNTGKASKLHSIGTGNDTVQRLKSRRRQPISNTHTG